MSSGESRITGYGVGAPKITLNPPPIISNRNPTTTDIRFPLGQNWVNKSTATIYELGSVSAGVATWVLLGGGTAAVATLTGNTGGAISPTGGNINILGAGTLSFAGSGSTLTGTITPGTGLISTINSNAPIAGNYVLAGTTNEISVAQTAGTTTFSTPSTFVAPGSIASTTSLTAGTTITATLGNITATNGNFVASTAGTGLVLPVATASGATPQVANARVGSVTFTTVSIAAGATSTFVITNSTITGSSTVVLYSLRGATTGAAPTIESVTNSAGSSSIVVTNGTGATTQTGNLTFDYIVLN